METMKNIAQIIFYVSLSISGQDSNASAGGRPADFEGPIFSWFRGIKATRPR